MERHSLALRLRRGRSAWEHQFILPDGRQPKSPQVGGNPRDLPRYGVCGEHLFEIVFGTDPLYHDNLFKLAAGRDRPVEPLGLALRLHLLLEPDDDDLALQAWSQLAYAGQRLAAIDWTVELRPAVSVPECPEYMPHAFRFPDRVVILLGKDCVDASHRNDIISFFRRHWQEAIPVSVVDDCDEFQTVMQEGTPRLVYYYGPADGDGIRLQTGVVDWHSLGQIIEASGTASILYLNLLGDAGLDAMPRGRMLLSGVRAAVLLQSVGISGIHHAAESALYWLRDVLLDAEDPILALHRHQTGVVCAWSRYTHWQCKPNDIPEDPLFVNLYLDREKQRRALLGAKMDFYTESRDVRIHHVVAYGESGNHVPEFPDAVHRYLIDNKSDSELFFAHRIRLNQMPINEDGMLDRIGSAVRRSLNWSSARTIDAVLVPEAAVATDIFSFVVLGWELPIPDDKDDAYKHYRALLDAVTHWCQTRLSAELGRSRRR